MRDITKQYVVNQLPVRDKDTYKGEMGRVLCIGGNYEMGGAITMTATAALYTGAGLVTVASDPVNVAALHAHAPEIMFSNMYNTERLRELIESMDVVVLGPGLGRDEKAMEIFSTVMETVTENHFLIIDADAITLFSQNSETYPINAEIIFTPHIGEWQRLSGLTQQEMTESGNQAAQKALDAVIILKGSPTKIYFPHESWRNTTGNPSQATGGMGDTLAGMVAGLMKQFEKPHEAIISAVFLHSYIADQLAKTHYVTLPSRIIKEIPQTMRHFAELKEKIKREKK